MLQIHVQIHKSSSVPEQNNENIKIIILSYDRDHIVTLQNWEINKLLFQLFLNNLKNSRYISVKGGYNCK